MSISIAIAGKAVELSAAPILFASLSQQVVGFMWYGIAFASVYCYFYAVDKGVKRAEYAIRRYSTLFKTFASLAANAVRSVLIAALISLLGASEGPLCVYLQAGAVVAAASLLGLCADVWADRPLPLVLVNGGASVAQALVAAAVMFHTKDIDFFTAAASADL